MSDVRALSLVTFQNERGELRRRTMAILIGISYSPHCPSPSTSSFSSSSSSSSPSSSPYHAFAFFNAPKFQSSILKARSFGLQKRLKVDSRRMKVSASLQQLDLTEENIRQVLVDARSELSQIFDASVGITGKVDLADLDGPFVKLSLKGRFWHKRSTVLARISTYLKNRIPEILEVDIEDEKQLDDSPENF